MKLIEGENVAEIKRKPEMTLLELSVEATPEAVDWVCTLLAQLDDIRDLQVSQLQSDRPHPARTLQMRWYMPYSNNANARVDALTQLLSPVQRTGLISEPEIYVIEEKPIALSTQAHAIGERFVVLPPDVNYQPTRSEEIPLRLETSLAFGSGFHPATILALKLIERHVKTGMQAIDLGSGTGILGVAMAKLGAHVLAIDNDPTAVAATQQTIEQNQVSQQVTAKRGSLGQGSELGHWMGGELEQRVPIVQPPANCKLIVANILARIHMTLAPDYQQILSAERGLLITAGFTTEFEAEVNAAFDAAGFDRIDVERSDDWVALVHRSRG